VLTVLGETERFGAICANRCSVSELIEEGGRAAGVRVRDELGGGEFDLRAETVVNATGVWADRLRPTELHEEAEVPVIRPSRGTHLTIARSTLAVDAGVIVPAGGGRSIFVLPWLGRTLVGTTDRDYEGDLTHVAPDVEDIDYLLNAVNEFFGSAIERADLTGAYAGVRPLISTGDPKKSVDISRKEELYETSSGMLTITGGKLTTWRRMAQLTVDRLVEREGREAPCRTREIPLGLPAEPGELPAIDGVDRESLALLAHRYGHAANEVLRVARSEPALARRIVPDLPDLLAEVVIAARYEQASTIADVLLRRTRLGLLDGPRLSERGSEEVRAVGEVLGGELGWDKSALGAAIDDWHRTADAEGIAPPGSSPPR
ncbi:MAG: FAD-dependent oxidoreductase, partial [Thermoleophilaceae bacterium]|nr:FAD-dependent oxidoreductase [Thermoleophilaceae bacterium]